MIIWVVVIVAVAGAAAYLIWGGDSGSNNSNTTAYDIGVGKFLKYEVVDTHGETNLV